MSTRRSKGTRPPTSPSSDPTEPPTPCSNDIVADLGSSVSTPPRASVIKTTNLQHLGALLNTLSSVSHYLGIDPTITMSKMPKKGAEETQGLEELEPTFTRILAPYVHGSELILSQHDFDVQLVDDGSLWQPVDELAQQLVGSGNLAQTVKAHKYGDDGGVGTAVGIGPYVDNVGQEVSRDTCIQVRGARSES
ncbi:hypothetical protein VNO78_34664 [Psophocarpus tetragonolobus]|uniref:Uncharacterized protein n=1 Tax=Psophocarpus tetragonolobus TaxID=3891 RepID=A0AAN9NNG5_PSOTE